MNKVVVFCGLAFIGGVLVGSAGSLLYLKWKKFRDEKNEESKRITSANIFEEVNSEPEVEDLGDVDQITDNKESEKNEEADTRQYYQDASCYEHPEDDEENDDESPEDVEGEYEARMMNDRSILPKLIKAEDYGEFAGNDKIELFYYIEDGVLTNEEDEPVYDVQAVVGDCLTKFGFNENDEDIIFVRNMKMGADFEIKKMFSSYVDTHD